MQPIAKYRTVEDLPAIVPVFPLRGCILLPRSTLPLNVFELRYLQMIDDVIAGNRMIGILQPSPEAGDRESPPGKRAGLRDVGCIGRITGFEEQTDGRVHISLTGICRFATGPEHDTATPYRTFAVAYAPFANDLKSNADDQEIDRVSLLRALKAYLEANRLETNWSAIERASNEALVNSMALAGPFGSEEKQALLEAPDLKARAEVLVALAEMSAAAGRRGQAGAGGRLQ